METPAEGTQAEAMLARIAPPTRGFGIGTGQLLWGNSSASSWQGNGDNAGATGSFEGVGSDGSAQQDMDPLADAVIGELTAL